MPSQIDSHAPRTEFAEEALRKSETRFCNLFQASPDAIFVTDLNGVILDANRTACQWLGLSAAELSGHAIAELAPPGLPPALLERLRTIEAGQVSQIEMVLLAGRRGPIPVSVSCTRFEDAQHPSLLLHARDISRRRDAEQRLRASEERLKRFFDASEDGVLFHSDGTILDANEVVGELFGLPVADLLHRPMVDFVAPNERREIGEALRRERDATYRFTGLSADGTRLFLELISRTMLSDGNRLQVAVIRDIGDQIRREEVLLLSERKYRRLFEDSHDAIFINSADGKIEAVNQAAVKLFGFESAEELLDHNAWEFYPDRAQRQELLDELHEHGFVADFELNLKDQMGNSLVVQETATAEKDAHGNLVRYRGILRDVTRQRALEDTVRRTHRMEAVGRLAGGVAHDFNNLLTAIGGYAEMCLGMTEESDPIYPDLNEILQATDRAAGLTRQLLAFSRQQVLEPSVLDLSDLVCNFKELLERTLGEDIDFSTRLAPNPWNVKADPGQIEQVVMNLAVNARDAMPDGGLLAIETGNVHLYGAEIPNCSVQPGDYVMLSVSDNGCGIDSQSCRQAFEPFFTTKKEGKGTGLGLATVYGIVKQSGGYISIESRIDEGTVVKVYLPRVDEPLQPHRAEESIEPLPADSRTILVAEDNPIVLRLVIRVLEELGHEVIAADTPARALELAKKTAGPIDLLLTDVVMPGMNGLELAERIISSRTETRLLFMSGYSKEVKFTPGHLSAGEFLQKPFTRKALRQKVTTILTDTTESNRERNAVA